MQPLIKHLLCWSLCFGAGACSLPSAEAHALKPLVMNLSGTEDGLWNIRLLQRDNETRLTGVTTQVTCGEATNEIPLDALSLGQTHAFDCGRQPLDSVGIEGLASQLLEVIVRIEPPSQEVSTHLVSGANPLIQLQSSTPSLPTYLSLGVQHLLTGFDHILFVLLLLLVASGWRSIFFVITSFTLAHSITLGLSTLDLIHLSQLWVEIVIALSIVLLAREAMTQKRTLSRRYPWVIAFGFGLIHGLGFAGALRDIGLPEDAVFMSLLLFNLGIELGQLGIAGVAVFTRYLATQYQQALAHRVDQGLAITAGGFGLYWMLSRSLGGL
jgi:hydrogenase/urease accessory protein HupE